MDSFSGRSIISICKYNVTTSWYRFVFSFHIKFSRMAHVHLQTFKFNIYSWHIWLYSGGCKRNGILAVVLYAYFVINMFWVKFTFFWFNHLKLNQFDEHLFCLNLLAPISSSFLRWKAVPYKWFTQHHTPPPTIQTNFEKKVMTTVEIL